MTFLYNWKAPGKKCEKLENLRRIEYIIFGKCDKIVGLTVTWDVFE